MLAPLDRYSLRKRPFAFRMTSLRRNQYMFYERTVRGRTEPDRQRWLGEKERAFARTSTIRARSQLTRKYNGRGTSHEAQDRRPRRAYVGEVLFVRHGWGCLCFFFVSVVGSSVVWRRESLPASQPGPVKLLMKSKMRNGNHPQKQRYMYSFVCSYRSA